MARNKTDTTGLVLAKLNKIKTGKDESDMFEAVRSKNGVLSEVKYVIKTGLKPFDDITGCIPVGRITELYGLDASGKTAIAVLISGKAKLGEIYEVLPDKSLKKLEGLGENYEVTVLYFDNEGSLSEDKIVIDGKEVDAIISQCNTIDQMFKVVDSAIDELNKVQEETGILQFLVVVTDTISSTATTEEITQEWAKQDYPRHSVRLRRGFRTLMRKLSRQNVAFICTNQVGDSFKIKRGYNNSPVPQDSDFSSFGGKSLRFYSRLRVFMCKATDSYKVNPNSPAPDGLLIEFFVSKNSQKMPLRKGRLVLLYSTGYSPELSLMESLIRNDRIRNKGNKEPIEFLFEKFNVPIVTYKTSESGTLQDEDDVQTKRRGRKSRNPKIQYRYEFIKYYHEHQQEFDFMWDDCVKYLFSADYDRLNNSEDELDEDGLPSLTGIDEDLDDE